VKIRRFRIALALSLLLPVSLMTANSIHHGQRSIHPVSPQSLIAQGTVLEKGEKVAVVEKVGDLLTVNYVFADRAALAKAKITAALTAGAYDKIADPSAFAQITRRSQPGQIDSGSGEYEQ
jgi:hypothetical protein